jgi:cholest-4-en-3-one 26-monooxygenase
MATDLGQIDLLDLDRWQNDGAPHGWFATLRREAPVWRHPSAGDGRGFWVISRYDDVVSLGRRPRILSSSDDYGGVFGLGPGDELQARNDGMETVLQALRSNLGDDARGILNLDPPEHTIHRKSVHSGFKSRIVGRLEPQVRARVSRLLDALPAGPFDFVSSVSKPLAVHVVGDLIGVPSADHDQIRNWTDELVGGSEPQRGLSALGEAFQYFVALQSHRPATPADGFPPLVSFVGPPSSPARTSIFLVLVASAGNESTSAALSHAALAFAEFPGEWDHLRRDPSLLPSAVDEVLRWASPAAYFRRNALTTFEIRGMTVEPGDLVSLWYLSANRDSDHFVDPDRFDIARAPNHHVAFGGGGPHFCLGAHVARLELRVLLEELTARYRAIELAGPVRYLRSNAVNGVAELPIRVCPLE